MRLRITALLSAVVLALVSVASFAAAPACVVGAPGVAPGAQIAFAPPTTDTDTTPIATPLTYNLYMGTASGAETKVASGLTGSPITVNTALQATSTYYFEVTVVDKSGTESAKSNEVCKSFPASSPNTVTITIAGLLRAPTRLEG